VARLLELADGEIQTLRGYVRDLRAGGAARSAGLLTGGVRRFCERFTAATGIQVDVSMEGQPLENPRLAAEVFQMVTEALSNVRRHTPAARAEVRIAIDAERLHLTVANEACGAQPFSPRTLTERAAALGGSMRIDTPPGGPTAVHVEVPL
jgi:signal transduction histidine kinase